MTLPHILLVDDEPNLLHILKDALVQDGYTIDTATDGSEAIEKLAQSDYDVVVLDLEMESTHGLDVLRFVRQQNPNLIVIVLTAHGSMESAIEALRLGAFDYLLKPTPLEELRQRIQIGVQHRRQISMRQQLLSQFDDWYQSFKETFHKEDRLTSSAAKRDLAHSRQLTFDNDQLAVTIEGKISRLTTTEYNLLLSLVQAAPKVLSARQLVNFALGYDCDDSDARDIIKWHIHHLRQKIESDPSNPRYIKTVRGRGYVWAGD